MTRPMTEASDLTTLIERSGPRASVRVHLTNPESGYESETETTVSPGQWAVIDAVLCGREQPYASASDLLASCAELRDRLRAFVGAVAEITDCGPDVDAIVRAEAAILKAKEASQ